MSASISQHTTGWELVCETRNPPFKFAANSTTRDEILFHLKTFLNGFAPDLISISACKSEHTARTDTFNAGAHVSTEHDSGQTVIAVRWALNEKTGFKFIEPERLYDEIRDLLHSGITSITTHKLPPAQESKPATAPDPPSPDIRGEATL